MADPLSFNLGYHNDENVVDSFKHYLDALRDRLENMPLQHGFLSLRWPFSTMAVLPGPPALRG